MPSLDEIMKMAEAAQQQLAQAQENLDKVEVEGASGGGLVKIRATACWWRRKNRCWRT